MQGRERKDIGMAGGEGCQAGVLLWQRREKATVADWGQEEPKHLASVFLSIQWE